MTLEPAGSGSGRCCSVAVRELCEFAAKSGDLDTRFTPSPTSEEGIAGHKIVASRRRLSHRAEVKVSGTWRDLLVRGRADGFDPDAVALEEVKTFKGRLDLMPANKRALHWAQAKVYGALQQLLGNADDAAAVVLYAPLAVGQSDTAAVGILSSFAAENLTQIDALLQRARLAQ